MKKSFTFVTGYFGAPIRETAETLAREEDLSLVDLDARIEAKDGRSIARICMMSGEHAYRNQEYEQVEELTRSAEPAPAGMVVLCGDGILHDDQTRELILPHRLVIAGEDLSLDCLWERARTQEETYHAFMRFGTEEEKRKAFDEHHTRQQKLFRSVIG